MSSGSRFILHTAQGAAMTKVAMYSSLKEKAYHRIKQDIMQGKLLPGTLLSDALLARRMRISRTPVREALHLLQQEGLVEIIPGRGTFVKEISLQEVLEILQIRMVLESLAVKLAAERIEEKVLAELEEEFAQVEAALTENRKTPEELQAFGARLHEAILSACGNRTLTELINTLRERIYRAKRFAFDRVFVDVQGKYTNRLYQSIEEHRRILKALQARDGELAAALMQTHLDNGRKALLEQFM
ncbi:MAG: GntR family transcriptional regulator [Nitrospinota bacterium]|nr:MAG: GntR family transcriptional regulator [Nitrospinota bacterium]